VAGSHGLVQWCQELRTCFRFRLGRKDKRYDGRLDRMLCRRNRLGIDIERRLQRRVSKQFLHTLNSVPTLLKRVE
jgi:hypothetical protein